MEEVAQRDVSKIGILARGKLFTSTTSNLIWPKNHRQTNSTSTIVETRCNHHHWWKTALVWFWPWVVQKDLAQKFHIFHIPACQIPGCWVATKTSWGPSCKRWAPGVLRHEELLLLLPLSPWQVDDKGCTFFHVSSSNDSHDCQV